MNRFVRILAAALPLTLAGSALAAGTDQLAATKHNFGSTAYNMGVGVTLCQPCHTPHHAVTSGAVSARLWNHALSQATYTLYDGTVGSYTGDVDGSQSMDRVSRLCLGCHDGTVALDSFGMGPTGAPASHVGSLRFVANDVNNLGTDFTDDHPVGVTGRFLKPDGTAVSSYNKAATVTFKTGTDATSGIKSATVVVPNSASTLKLAIMADGYAVVGCKTCHNPHGSGTTAYTPYAHLLAVDPANLCNTCHTK